MAFGKTLSLGKKLLDDTKLTEKLKKDYLEKGKKSNKSSTVKDDFEKVVTEGKDGKGKTISYIKKGSNLSKDKQVSKRAENLATKQKKTKKAKTKVEPVKKGKKVYDKPIGPQPKPKSVKVYDKPIGPLPKPKSVSSKKVQVNKRAENLAKKQKKTRKTQTVKKGKTVYNKPAGPFPKVYKKPIGPQPKSFFQKYKKPILGAALVAGTSPFLIDKGNVGEGKNIGGGNKDKKPLKKLKNIKVKTIKTKPLQQKKKDMPKVSTQKKSRSNIKGSSSYDAQFTYDNLKKRGLNPKGRMSPENYAKVKKLKDGTKDKTIGKPMSPKDALNKKFKDKSTMYKLIMGMTNKKPTRKRTMVEKIFGGFPDEAYNLKKGQIAQGANKQARKEMKKEYPKLMKRITKKSAGKTVGLKDLPPKSKSPGIHKLPAKAKMNMGFKPMFGGGFISSLYDKPEKIEKYKGNTTSARQVKGYGKAKKKA